jgi:hypothetical protein
MGRRQRRENGWYAASMSVRFSFRLMLGALHLATALYLCSCGSTGANGNGNGNGSPDASAKDATRSDARDAESLDGFSVPSGCNPLGITDDCMLPYPSDFLTKTDTTTPTGLRVNLSPNSLVVPKGATPIDMTPFNRADGAPTSAPVLVNFGVDVDASFLANEKQTASSVTGSSAIALFAESTGDRVPFLSEMDANEPGQTGRHALIIRPLVPLAFGEKYVVALSNRLRDTTGHALPVSKGFVALRDSIPTDVAAIEKARPHFETIFSLLSAHGYPRDSLALAWDYTTASKHTVIGPITTMRQEVFHASTAYAPSSDGGLPPPDAGSDGGVAMGDGGDGGDAGSNSDITYAIDSITPSPYQAGAIVVEGTFTPPNYLMADNTIDYSTDNVPSLQTSIPRPSYPFTMIVPPLGMTQSLSLVLFGHGLFGDGRDYLTSSYGSTIQPLAQTLGAVVVATDWIGLSSGDLNLIISDVAPNLNRVGIVTDRLLQALVNNLSLIELSLGALSADPRVRLSTTQPLLDPSRVYYYGVSLGGIEGSSLISVARNVTRAAVAVPGASWNNLLARSYDYAQIKLVITADYPDALVQQEFIGLLQSHFDPADPVNLATLFQKSPLPDSPSSRTVVIQESIDDCQVPNLTTEILARTYGVPEITPNIVPIYGVGSVKSPTNHSALSQFELQSDVAKYVPPTTNVLPTMDNGAHFDLAFQLQAVEEVSTLFNKGQIEQDCSGACLLP